MRILHVISGIDPRSGGPTSALCAMAKAQVRAAGIDVSVLATWQTEQEVITAERLRASGVHVRLVGPARGCLRRHPELKAAAHEAVDRADVVHIHALWEEIQHQAAAAARKLAKPYVFRPCGMLDPWSLRQHRLRKMAYMMWRLRRDLHEASAIHFTSALACELAAPLGLRAPVIVEPLGLDLSDFDHQPSTDLFRQQFHRLGDRPYLIFFGRMCHKKGLDLLIPAFARARRVSGSDAMLVIAGPDSNGYRTQVEQSVRHHHLNDHVLFTGMLVGDQRLAALRGARFFVLPSRQENFGLAVVEAMACGCPVIVSDRVNIYREIREAGAGSAVSLDGGSLERELVRWLANPSLSRAAAGRAARFVRAHYDQDRIANGWGDHYDYLIRSRRPEHQWVAPEPTLVHTGSI